MSSSGAVPVKSRMPPPSRYAVKKVWITLRRIHTAATIPAANSAGIPCIGAAALLTAPAP